MHGDQTGRDGGTKKVKEENETLDDLQQNEDERGCFQPLWKMDTEAAERTPSRTANVLRRLDERRTYGDENRSCSKILQHHRITPSHTHTHTYMRRMRSVCNHHSKILQHHRITPSHSDDAHTHTHTQTYIHTTHAIRL